MPARALLGRVGVVVVAMGIGAALTTGWGGGVAWADEAGSSATHDSTKNTTDSAGEKPHAPRAGGPNGSGTKRDGAKRDGTKRDGAKGDGADDANPTEDAHDTPGVRADDADVRSPRDRNRDKHDEPSAPRRSNRHTLRTPQEKSPVGDAPRAHVPRTADTKPTSRATPSAAPPAIGAAEPARAQPAALRIAPAQPAIALPPRPVPILAAVTRLVSDVVAAVLNPFVGNAPKPPGDVPAVWSIFAFARREFERAFAPRTVVHAAPNPVGVSAAEPERRTLVLTAFPAEADAVLARTTLDVNPAVVVDGHHFYLGTMGGKKVIVAMTGIGMVNATQTTETALNYFTPESGVTIDAVVFSGVAGGSGRTEIGSVAVPARWTSDDGATWHPVDPEMLAAANAVTVDLDSMARLGNPTCLCSALSRLPLVDLGREPQLFVGGDGSSDDNNNGVAFPAIPFGGDIFGPQPCLAPDRSLFFVGNFFQAITPFLTQGLFSNLLGLLSPSAPPVDAVDQETAAAQAVADAHGIPFLGIRGMSDGPGDPLNLPGYPFTFVVYRELAAGNAATVAEAFLEGWEGPTDPT